MKTKTNILLTLLAAASIVPATAGSQETHGDPYMPVGSLNVSKRLVRTGVDETGAVFAAVMSFDDYVTDVEDKLADIRFSEIEIAHTVTIVGNVAQVSSVYEFQFDSADERREERSSPAEERARCPSSTAGNAAHALTAATRPRCMPVQRR